MVGRLARGVQRPNHSRTLRWHLSSYPELERPPGSAYPAHHFKSVHLASAHTARPTCGPPPGAPLQTMLPNMELRPARTKRQRAAEPQQPAWEEDSLSESESVDAEPPEPAYSSDEDSREFKDINWQPEAARRRWGAGWAAQDPQPRDKRRLLRSPAAGRSRTAISWTGALEARFLKALQQAGGVWVSRLLGPMCMPWGWGQRVSCGSRAFRHVAKGDSAPSSRRGAVAWDESEQQMSRIVYIHSDLRPARPSLRNGLCHIDA